MRVERRTYPLPTDALPTLLLSDHLEDLAEIVRLFNGFGVDTRSTRIARYVQYIEQVGNVGLEHVQVAQIFRNSADASFQDPGDWYLYVLREVHELMWILAGIRVHVPQGIDAKLRLIASGRDFAAFDADSASRNTQFELRIASYFCQAGCSVDLSSDTDIVAITGSHAFFVECKRLASARQLHKRVSEARSQLARRMPRKDGRRLVLGCVAVDVTKVAFAHNGLTWGITNDHARDVVQERLVSIAEAAHRDLSFGSPRKLLCYWLQVHIASLVMRPAPMPATRFSSYHIARERLTTKEARLVAHFRALFESVSREDRRSLPGKRFTPRTRVEFPAGTTFQVDEDRLVRLLAQSPTSDADLQSVIASVNIGGSEHNFTFFEFTLLSSDATAEWMAHRADDRVRAVASLGAFLYMQRFPYEKSPQDQ